ncbi:MAG: 50S ribosomal protein L25/general stress protein Ctc [Gammaproteobacteria bacterium]|nr:50S ribosomal protein L25/general stress protein Ctc [Gammaproteobacteria bacterium]
MSEIALEAEPRALIGKGASRRLRRLDNKVPAVIYGGNKPSQAIQFLQKHVQKTLESESIYSSVFDVLVDGKKESVILKDIQRHPYKTIILHMDLQRVSSKDVLVKIVPLHFMNEEEAPGVKEGGVVNHTMTQVEVRCEVRHLPEFIEIDLAGFEMDQVLHLSEVKLPKGVELSIDPTTGDHDHPVVSVHEPRVVIEEEPEVEAEEGEEGAEGAEGEATDASAEEASDESKKDDAKEDGKDKPAAE